MRDENKDSEAQIQFAVMVAGAAISRVVEQEREERIKQMKREQDNLIKWRLVPKIKQIKRR